MTRTQIINTAFRVWGRNFYRKTSLSHLAAELKVSKPALYRHFSSKRALTAAMTESFFDDFAACIKTNLNNASGAQNPDDGISLIIKSISGFFAENVHALFFFLINIYDRNIDGQEIADSLKSRGADMNIIQALIEKKYIYDTLVVRLIFATLTFLLSHFHMNKKSMENPPSAEDVNNITCIIWNTIENGLGAARGSGNDFEKLEKQVEAMPLGAHCFSCAESESAHETESSESSRFFKAVAEAVAEAGPWDVSMEMVAKKLGLSKSSLYVHFKNRKDMLRRLFITEFKRIIAFAGRGISLSSDAKEQLYLGIYTISVYLRARPEVLIAIDWIRTRKLDLGKADKHLDILRLFEDIDIKPPEHLNKWPGEKQRTSHWILFLLINVLTHSVPQLKQYDAKSSCAEHPAKLRADSNKKTKWLCGGLCISSDSAVTRVSENMQKNYIRMLFKFILHGLGGFKK